MRYFHYNKNKYFCPIINLDKIWSLVGEEVSAAQFVIEFVIALCCAGPLGLRSGLDG